MNRIHTNTTEVDTTHASLIVEIAIKSPERLKRFLRRWERDETAIDDIIGEALINALLCIDTYTGESSIGTWFFGVCKNTARQYVAAKVRMATRICYMDEFESHVADLDDINTQPLDEEISQKEMLQKVVDSVSDLPSDLQFIFQAVYVDGLSYSDVAQQLNIPLGTLKSRVNRMRTSLIGIH